MNSRNSVVSTGPGDTVVKLYLNIADKGMGHYRSFKVDKDETFGSLKNRVLDKIAVNREDSAYYTIILKFLPDTGVTRCSIRLRDEENVIDVMEREQANFYGDFL